MALALEYSGQADAAIEAYKEAIHFSEINSRQAQLWAKLGQVEPLKGWIESCGLVAVGQPGTMMEL